ncbi:MAG TPA: CHASE2 domain-containing protein [Terriglobales bacterium]|nr:CHASE2 domain-containing protein [Terriglobales bacterium]
MRALRRGDGRPFGFLLLVLLVAILLAPRPGPVEQLRLASFDTWQMLAPRRPVSAPAVIVAIDDESLKRHGQWPWPRTTLARLIDRIADADPAVVGLDIVMPEPDRLSPHRWADLVPGLAPDVAERLARVPSNDGALAAALARTRTVLGAGGLDEPDPAAGGARGGWAPMRLVGEDPRPFVRRFPAVLRSIDEIDRAATGRALLNGDRERGVVRRIPLVAVVGDTLVPGLGAELLRVAGGAPGFTVVTGAHGVTALAVGDVRIPAEPDGSLRVHYSRHVPARFVSAVEVLAGTVPAERFARKIVLVGVTATGLSDYVATPVADRMPGVEIHAQGIENVFDGVVLRRPAWTRWGEAAVLALLGVAVVFAVPALRRRAALALFAGLIAALWLLGFAVYHHARVLVDAAAPTVALGLLFSVMVSLTLAEVDSHRRALRRQLQEEREAAARLAGELEAARRIQMGILPRPDALPGNGARFELHPFLEPARTVGGDLYDFFEPHPDRLFFLLGDVAGKGLPGCLFMALSKSLYKSTALRLGRDTAAMMTEANREISRENSEALFVTIFSGILELDTGVIEYANAGHDDPYVLHPGRPLRTLPWVGGPPLCVIEDFVFEAGRQQLEPGDTLCLMTDGVTEAMNPAGELYGRARLEAVLKAVDPARLPAAIVEAVRADVARFTAGAEPADDLAILVLRWNGPRAT